MKAILKLQPSVPHCCPLTEVNKGYLIGNQYILVIGTGDTCYGWLLRTKKWVQIENFVGADLIEVHSNLDLTSFYGLTTAGRIFSWGDHSFGQLGHDIEDLDTIFNSSRLLDYPEYIPLTDVKVIAVGWRFVVVLTKTGQIFSWGSNLFGQLGNDYDELEVISPTLVEMKVIGDSKIVHVSCSGASCVALSDNEEIYYWGKTSHGIIYTPRRMICELKFQQVACSASHCFGISGGRLFILCFDCDTDRDETVDFDNCKTLSATKDKKFDVPSEGATFHEVESPFVITSIKSDESDEKVFCFTSQKLLLLLDLNNDGELTIKYMPLP